MDNINKIKAGWLAYVKAVTQKRMPPQQRQCQRLDARFKIIRDDLNVSGRVAVSVATNSRVKI